jgi:recombinational DNA repair protein (RecF pathway)
VSYSTYTTEALVCGTFNRNTADRSYLLFTREAGMLYAEARSVREERSRQRMALQDFSLVRVSLIKGKASWKVGSIESQKNFFMLATDKFARGSVVSLTRFLRRFYGGQEAAPLSFDYIVSAFGLLSTDIRDREFVEKIIQAHLLLSLGYVDEKTLPACAIDQSLSSIELQASSELSLLLSTTIEKAVSLSHL